jgi:hypothetical protein
MTGATTALDRLNNRAESTLEDAPVANANDDGGRKSCCCVKTLLVACFLLFALCFRISCLVAGADSLSKPDHRLNVDNTTTIFAKAGKCVMWTQVATSSGDQRLQHDLAPIMLGGLQWDVYLVLFGSVSLVTLLYTLAMVALLGKMRRASRLVSERCAARCCLIGLILIGVLLAFAVLFHAAMTIVGASFLFAVIMPRCDSASDAWFTGCALFVSEVIFWALAGPLLLSFMRFSCCRRSDELAGANDAGDAV